MFYNMSSQCKTRGVTFHYSPSIPLLFCPRIVLNGLLEHFTADTFKIENRAFYAMNYKPFCFLRNF
nr:MAG TPA: hypothetical protein [Bacteriophage sp.]